MAQRMLKCGLGILGVGLLCYAVLYGVYGGLGPCALPGQLELILLGIAGTGLGGLICIISLIILLIGKYRNRDASSGISMF